LAGRAREAGCLWCDLEIETFRELREISPRLPHSAAHPSLRARFRAHACFGPAIAPPARSQANAFKIAAATRTIRDTVRLLQFASRSRNCVAVPWEKSASRRASSLCATAVPGLRSGRRRHCAGSSLPSADEASLPAHALNRQTRVYAVIGDPFRIRFPRCCTTPVSSCVKSTLSSFPSW